ncbi:UDP-2-acetamido-2,6-beta-L-arabino-hexul-4-ose reductase [Pantoea eucrina]|uniref:UDP-2-acetamido-2,6-beta-L-arabino-hexul-4-ose reductase n=1 Tax=Pantoea eucrina TaxID=472693 RepID=UPI00080F4E5E|nr:NAD-dependent epimerase/dehydratase family protein [Pantoea eucrina]
MKVLITGSDGFIAKNLALSLQQRQNIQVMSFNRESKTEDLSALIEKADFIFHLAGINRPQDPAEFTRGNVDLSSLVSEAIKKCVNETGRYIPVVFSSSIHASADNEYGRTKLAAENVFAALASETGNPVFISRLPGVFGKWARPNYNSVVATFCYNIAHDLPVTVNDPQYLLRLVYIDDVVKVFTDLLDQEIKPEAKQHFINVVPEYNVALGEIAESITSFREGRNSLELERVGTGFLRALYSTYVSYLPEQDFSYPVKQHTDPRGSFVELFKSKDSGQVSYFTAHPGITRGGHYHHTKTEKFMVISGTARFRFRHMLTDEYYETVTSGDKPVMVETIPGWAHDVTNISDEELIAIVWANEVFDPAHPDTIFSKLDK